MKSRLSCSEVMQRDVKAFTVPRTGWPAAFEQSGVRSPEPDRPKQYSSRVELQDGLGAEDTEHVAGTTSARDAAARKSRDGVNCDVPANEDRV